MTETVQVQNQVTQKKGISKTMLILLLLVVINVLVVRVYKPLEPVIRISSESLLYHTVDGEVAREPWFTIPFIGDVYLTNTLTSTFVVLVFLLLLAWAVHRQTSKGQLQTHGIVLILELLFSALFSMADNAVDEKWRKKIYPHFITIFLYVLMANLTKLLPFYETFGSVYPVASGGFAAEKWLPGFFALSKPAASGQQGYELVSFFRGASTDLNFTVAIAIIAVLMVQVYGLQSHGIGYLNKFINIRALIKKPKTGFLDFVIGILELISEIARIASFGFRLFGNMFAGMVLLLFLGYMVPWVLGSFIMLYELFVGFLQAFIFGMLTAVFMSMAVRSEQEE